MFMLGLVVRPQNDSVNFRLPWTAQGYLGPTIGTGVWDDPFLGCLGAKASVRIGTG